MNKIVVIGGHLTPALALVEELEGDQKFQIIFFGRKHATQGTKNLSAEYKIVSSKKIKFYALSAGRLQRKFTRYTVSSLILLPFGFLQSIVYLIMVRPKLVVSFGGYLSTPVVFAAWLLGIDSITHEQTSVPGLANRINSLFVKKVFLTWPGSQEYFAKDKAEVIGNLVRKSLQDAKKLDPKVKSFLDKSDKLILVTGGNQGSHFLNQLITKSVPSLKNYQVLHELGTANWGSDHQMAQKAKSPNYLAVEYLNGQDHGQVLKKASIVVSRSGANTIWEIAYFAKVAILVPLSVSSGNEQLKNAKILETAGSAIIHHQEGFNQGELLKSVERIFKDYPVFQTKAQSFSKNLSHNATHKLAIYIKNQLV